MPACNQIFTHKLKKGWCNTSLVISAAEVTKSVLTFPFLLLHAFPPSVDGGHLGLEGEVVVPDVLQLLLKERNSLQTAHLFQVS